MTPTPDRLATAEPYAARLYARRYPEVRSLRLPEGSLARIAKVAAARRIPSADWVRAAVLRALTKAEARDRKAADGA